MHDTREELDIRLERAVAAVRSALGSPGDEMHQIEAGETAAQVAVTEAARIGIHHRQIAERAGISGLRVLGYITDADLSHQALRAERHHAERYTAQVMDEIRGRALYLVYQGTRKTDVCATLGITRPALDTWIKADRVDVESPA